MSLIKQLTESLLRTNSVRHNYLTVRISPPPEVGAGKASLRRNRSNIAGALKKRSFLILCQFNVALEVTSKHSSLNWNCSNLSNHKNHNRERNENCEHV